MKAAAQNAAKRTQVTLLGSHVKSHSNGATIGTNETGAQTTVGGQTKSNSSASAKKSSTQQNLNLKPNDQNIESNSTIYQVKGAINATLGRSKSPQSVKSLLQQSKSNKNIMPCQKYMSTPSH